MTNPTDPRVEAATLALLETDNYDLSLSDISLEAHLKEPHSGDCTRESHSCLRCICESAQREAILILKAADAAAWQPIESAPKDGTCILVPVKHIGADVVSWHMNGWRETSNGLLMRDQPTHWVPLPMPPKAKP